MKRYLDALKALEKIFWNIFQIILVDFSRRQGDPTCGVYGLNCHEKPNLLPVWQIDTHDNKVGVQLRLSENFHQRGIFVALVG